MSQVLANGRGDVRLVDEACSSSEDEDLDLDHGNDDENYNDCEEEGGRLEEDGVPVQCVICPVRVETVQEVFDHLVSTHDIDILNTMRRKYQMDQVSYVKMINWIRKMGQMYHMLGNCSSSGGGMEDLAVIGLKSVLLETAPMNGTGPPWSDDKWLVPTVRDDPLLTFWFEEESEPEELEESSVKPSYVNQKSADNVSATSAPTKDVGLTSSPAKDGKGDGSDTDVEQLLSRMKLYKEQMMDVMGRVTVDDGGGDNAGASVVSSNVHHELSNEKRRRDQGDPANDDGNESEYFSSYDDLAIHAEMLKDQPRTLSYMAAIKNNPADFKGKTVLDLGCGTGILSFFAADSGAKQVFAVDVSKMIYEAMDICFENNKEDKVSFKCNKLEALTSEDIPKVDILVSEFMGYFLLFEGMTSSFLYARDNFLKPGGKMLPSSAEMFLAAVSDEEQYTEEVELWNNCYGYKMSALKKMMFREAFVKDVAAEAIVSEKLSLKRFDLHHCAASDLYIEGSFEFTVTKDCNLTGLCGYFDTEFGDGSEFKTLLSTSPSSPRTHWKQVMFYLPQKIPVKGGQKLGFEFSCKPHKEFPRWLEIVIKIGSNSYSYEMK